MDLIQLDTLSLSQSSNYQAVRWIEYTPKTRFDVDDAAETEDSRGDLSSPISLHLRIYTSLIGQPSKGNMDHANSPLKTLSGFDNTGNVQIWSSELLLAHAMLCAAVYPGLYQLLSGLFSRGGYQRICELGAGMTGAAGLATCTPEKQKTTAICPNYMLLTDGNERCVQSLEENVKRQIARFQKYCTTSLKLEASRLSWAIEVSIAEFIRSFIPRNLVFLCTKKKKWFLSLQ